MQGRLFKYYYIGGKQSSRRRKLYPEKYTLEKMSSGWENFIKDDLMLVGNETYFSCGEYNDDTFLTLGASRFLQDRQG